METQTGPIQPVYVLFDASGSTRRSGLNQVCNEALPQIVDLLARSADTRFQLALLSYSDDATMLLGCTDIEAIDFLPQITPGRFSSVSAGLRLLGSTIAQDHHHFRADDVAVLPVLVVVVTDGQPTDSSEDVRAAYQEASGESSGSIGELLVVLSEGEVATSIAGLGQGLARPDVDVVELPVIDPGALAMVVAGWLTRQRATA